MGTDNINPTRVGRRSNVVSRRYVTHSGAIADLLDQQALSRLMLVSKGFDFLGGGAELHRFVLWGIGEELEFLIRTAEQEAMERPQYPCWQGYSGPPDSSSRWARNFNRWLQKRQEEDDHGDGMLSELIKETENQHFFNLSDLKTGIYFCEYLNEYPERYEAWCAYRERVGPIHQIGWTRSGNQAGTCAPPRPKSQGKGSTLGLGTKTIRGATGVTPLPGTSGIGCLVISCGRPS